MTTSLPGGPFLALVALTSLPSAQQPTPPKVAWFPAATIAARQAETDGPWLPFLDRPTLTAGRYRLGKGTTDAQQPHDRDEIYFVVAGKAVLAAGGERHAMAAGDTAFVAAEVPHAFVDIEADLDVLVFFSSARRATGGMQGQPAPTEQTPFAESSARGNARIFYWFGPDSAGQVAIDFGRPRWQPTFGAFLRQPPGRRWRFGENFWTTLDTNMPLTLAGIDVPIGQYYLVLQTAAEGRLELVLLDPQAVRQRRLDAYEANKTEGGIVVPLQSAPAGALAGWLDVALALTEGKDRGELTIRFGPHRLTAAVQMHPHRP